MSFEVTHHNIKSIAKNLRALLKEHQLQVKHSQSLEILAKTFGFKDWNTFSAKLNEESTDQIVIQQPDSSKKEQLSLEGKQCYEAAIKTMQFVQIPAGSVQMSTDYTAEITKDFYLCDHPVTCKEYGWFLQDTGKLFRDRGQDDYPVVDVNWMHVMDYISWLNQHTENEIYRLPTEAEWEYACRAGTTTRYFFGDTDENLPKYCWYAKNSGWSLQPVKQLLPNPWGLYDMLGNISEWVHDYHGNYPSGHIKDPTGPKTGNERVLRGGSWHWGLSNPDSEENLIGLGSADRNAGSPQSCRNFIGFRLVRQSE